jgi:amidophosphoribosyltransferase
MAGMTGSGSAFVVRDPSGIRPAYYYANDEIVVVASEKPAIKTAFNIDYAQIEEIQPGHAVIIDKNGDFSHVAITPPLEKTSCSFERIYFSRGTDPEIYRERKQLGRLLVPQVLKSINFDLKNTVFSYIPNTAETAFFGLMEGIQDYLVAKQKDVIIDGKPSVDSIEEILSFRPRVEKIVIKDVKLRTFITDDDHRDEMVAHVYDTTYEVVNKGKDTLVVIDDSIVRGTTLEKSILKMLDRLDPKKIVVVSSAPQIRFPDCYGIDMSKMGDFVAFRAMIQLVKEQGKDYMLGEIYEQCRSSNDGQENFVKKLYKLFTPEEISDKIADIVRPDDMKADLQIVFQTIENLHKAIPMHTGDWYFTGNYPTQGGMKVANQSYLNYMDWKLVRAY